MPLGERLRAGTSSESPRSSTSREASSPSPSSPLPSASAAPARLPASAYSAISARQRLRRIGTGSSVSAVEARSRGVVRAVDLHVAGHARAADDALVGLRAAGQVAAREQLERMVLDADL